MVPDSVSDVLGAITYTGGWALIDLDGGPGVVHQIGIAGVAPGSLTAANFVIF